MKASKARRFEGECDFQLVTLVRIQVVLQLGAAIQWRYVCVYKPVHPVTASSRYDITPRCLSHPLAAQRRFHHYHLRKHYPEPYYPRNLLTLLTAPK